MRDKAMRQRTGKKAWLGRRDADVKAKGTKAPWLVFWNDPTSGKRKEKSCGPGAAGRRLAMKEVERLHGEIITGTYASKLGGEWSEFIAKFKSDILARKALATQVQMNSTFTHFERIVSPGKMSAIGTAAIDGFITKRLAEEGKKPGSTTSPATVNKDLRNLRAALRKAHKWGYLPIMPDITFEREPEKAVRWMTDEHFAAIYAKCDSATLPANLPYSAGDWWKAIIVTTFLTGWRIGETMALKWEHVNLETGEAKILAGKTKGRRDEVVRLHPVIIDHLKRIRGFGKLVFPFTTYERKLYEQFHAIQAAAGIHLPCDGEHEHTPSCHVYGFHDERRAFGTMNAATLTGVALQKMMRHKNFATTQKYIDMASQVKDATSKIHVPAVLTTKTEVG